MVDKVLKKGEYPITDRKQIAEAILEIYKDDFNKLENCKIEVVANCGVYIDVYYNDESISDKLNKIIKRFAKSIDIRNSPNTMGFKYNTYFYINREFIPKVNIPYKALL